MSSLHCCKKATIDSFIYNGFSVKININLWNQQTSKLSIASTHAWISPSNASLAYSSGSSIANALSEFCEQGVVLNPSSALLQFVISCYQIFFPCFFPYQRSKKGWNDITVIKSYKFRHLRTEISRSILQFFYRQNTASKSKSKRFLQVFHP